ncbi:hypothetical protein VIGAN_01241400 [Vigna angularis var. angularis]|uniref:Uncharacterized protein n=1 Tax=Vigna angularis var. angularis TaxID=157739 RepID=A0A0S3R2C4_PHAAN|nr:uncharacterized protein LOC108338653 isoform X1 [Vigna angularis]XP_052723416.1 uncharacterized protein LOC108338653 isoform X1 [Vigna angularis]BAT74694.1 hypothetical protein VIGAN_01241400 [Vigna angularis var. angularis]
MSFLSWPSSHSWQPTKSADTTALSYWLNWRFLFCALWILGSMALAFFLIFKYEGFNKSRSNSVESEGEETELLHEDEAWNTCLIGIDPSWLLIYRVICFIVLLALIIASVAADGAVIFYFYTQWTFTLVTIYFGLGSYFSLYGCSLKQDKITVNDAEVGIVTHDRKIASLWGYVFQIIFQSCAGAVVLTDSVFWFILYPRLSSSKDYSVDFLVFCMHSINALFLLGDTSLNCMRFPMFRFAYFVLWTATFVIFQWIIHVCVSLWWPYPFLDLSSPYAPLWCNVQIQVLGCGFDALSMLWRLCFNNKDETLVAINIISWLFPLC